MTNNGIINIHGKDYMTVAGRVDLLHNDQSARIVSFKTKVLSHSPVVVKATVTIERYIDEKDSPHEAVWVRQTFEGVSAANPLKSIEKMSPYEVAETSAVGRALGFAGYGAIESIASADEVIVAQKKEAEAHTSSPVSAIKCEICGAPAQMREGVSKKSGKPYKAVFCSSQDATHTKWINETVEDLPVRDVNDDPYGGFTG